MGRMRTQPSDKASLGYEPESPPLAANNCPENLNLVLPLQYVLLPLNPQR
jgi:hypothetical protein